MIYFPLSAISRSTEEVLNPAVTLTGEGQAMISVLVNGVSNAQPSSGIAAEKFLGFSLTQTSAATFLPTTTVKVESLVVPISGIVTTAQTPVAATTFAYNDATGAAVTVVSVTGTSVDLGVISAGLTVRVQYRYTLTVVQAQSLVGSVQPGGYSGAVYGRVGIAQSGVIYTDNFDSSKDFSAATSIKLDANGRVSDQSHATGVVIPAFVKSLPTVSFPFLALEFNAI
jgi:hypothetical protein